MANKNGRLTIFSDLRKGQYLSEQQYYKIVSVDDATIDIVNERNLPFTIGKSIVEEGMHTANQVDETVEVTRTELVEIFSKVGDVIFTINFNKQPTADVINDAIESANRGKILPIKDLKKLVKDAYKGEERTLIGYLVSNETGFGRSMVIDLELERGNNPDWDARIRQVDHRTLNWLIFKRVKYVVKKK